MKHIVTEGWVRNKGAVEDGEGQSEMSPQASPGYNS